METMVRKVHEDRPVPLAQELAQTATSRFGLSGSPRSWSWSERARASVVGQSHQSTRNL